MALNFPNPALQTPLNEFSPDSTPAKSTNGVTYVWTNNEKWVASSVVFNDIYVNVTGDNMTGDLTLGTDKITLNATDGSGFFKSSVSADDFFIRNGNDVKGYFQADSSRCWLASDSSTPFCFDTNALERMRIDSSGDVLIGGTLPSAPNISLNANGDGFVNRLFCNKKSIVAADNVFGINDGDLSVGEEARSKLVIKGDGTTYISGTFIENNSLKNPNIALNAGGNIVTVGDIQSTSQNSGQLAGFRNQIICGNMEIAQRSATGSGTGYKTVDRWFQYNGAGNVYTQRQDGFGPFAQSIRLLDNEASGDAYIAQGIELPFAGYQGQFETGSTWTLSFWSTVATSASNINIAWQDTISSPGGVANTVGPVVIGETRSGYTHYSFRVTISAAAPVSATCLRVLIAYTAPVDASITGVQFEPGPVATPFEHRPIGTELALCQRYYQKGRYVGILNFTSADFFHWTAVQSLRNSSPTTTTTTVSGVTAGSLNVKMSSNQDFYTGANSTGTPGAQVAFNWTADAEL